MQQILKEPNQLLHRVCEPVTDLDEAKRIADELLIMIKSVSKFWNRWLGLAANQIGYDKKIITLRRGKDVYEVMVNPSLTEKKFPFPYLERCYSVNGVYFVKRYLRTKVKYQDLNGNWHKTILKGISAVYQEVDHIGGILISEIGWRVI